MVQDMAGPYAAGPLWSGTPYGWAICCRTIMVQDVWPAHMLQDHYGPGPMTGPLHMLQDHYGPGPMTGPHAAGPL